MSSNKNALNVGLLIDQYLNNWQAELVHKISESDNMRIALVIKNSSFPKKYTGIYEKISLYHNLIIYWLFQNLDQSINVHVKDAFAPSLDSEKLLSKIPTIECTPIQTKFSDRIEDEDLKDIYDFDLDVAIRLGFRILRGDALKMAKYGVWSFHNADNMVNRGGPGGFWEVIENKPEQGNILQILNEKLDDGLIVTKSWAATNTKSVNANRNNYFWKCPSICHVHLERLSKDREAYLEEIKRQNSDPLFYSNDLYRPPTNSRALVCLSKFFIRRARERILSRKLKPQLHYNTGPVKTAELRCYEPIVPPEGVIWSEAHVLETEEGGKYIFARQHDAAGNRIVEIEVGNDNVIGPAKVLDLPGAKGFPFAFEDNGMHYLLPSSENDRIRLFVRTDQGWQAQSSILDNCITGRSIIARKDDRYWLFASLSSNEYMGRYDELFMFYSERLSGPWLPHPLNPVISDARCAAPAGAIFTFKGNLYRPAWDVTKCRIVIRKIEEWTTEKYREVNVQLINAEWLHRKAQISCFSQQENIRVLEVRA